MRCRPLFGKELKEGRAQIVECDVPRGEIRIANPESPSDPPKLFTFDNVYDARNTQKEIYEETALPIVRAAIEGYNGTIFCYGQTGTGKTHSMEGKEDPPSERGIIPNAFETVFADIDASESANKNFLVRASFLEIYNENIRDLLAKDQSKTCALKETPDRGVYVQGLTTFVVKSVAEIRHVLEVGKKNRSVGATLMNSESSRSHSIFTITVETSETPEGASDADAHIRVGKLNLVDLAGSERQSKTQASGDRLKEATKINLSLSTLGNVISALVDGKSQHIPYRNSKLTRLLQDSLGGNTKTVMMANLGPADYNFDETMGTLRYANRAKNIKNTPKINEDPKDAMLREFQEEIARLKARLGEGGGGGGGRGGGAPRRPRDPATIVEKTVYSSDRRLEQIKEDMRVEMEANARRNLAAEEAERAQALVALKARKQMQALMEEKERSEEERSALEDAFRAQQADAATRFAEIQKEQDEQRALEERLAAMQAKVVKGGTNLLDQEERLLEEARRREEALARIAASEAEQARRLKELEDLETITGEKYKNIEEEIEGKRRKTQKLHEATRRVLVDAKDLDAEFEREREDLLEEIRGLTRQIKLKNLVLDACVPPDELQRLQSGAEWDDRAERWRVERAAQTGNARRAEKFPNSRRGKAAEETRGRTSFSTNADERLGEEPPPPRPPNPRVVAALADAFGDADRATLVASRSFEDALRAKYYQYREGRPAGGGGGSGGAGSGGSGSRADAQPVRPGSARPGKKPRERPGSARPRGAGAGAGAGAAATQEEEARRFPTARGLVR